MLVALLFFFFFFNDTATTEIYTLSLHDALPILQDPRNTRSMGSPSSGVPGARPMYSSARVTARRSASVVKSDGLGDRKSTRLNSSHSQISYAVFCLKKKKKVSNYHITVPHHTTT